MHDINKPMDVAGLRLQPPITKTVKLTADMQQTLALLTAYGDSARKLLRASESGVLNTASAKLKDIVHYDRVDPANPTQGDDITCTECLIMAHPDNVGKVWVKPHAAATTANAWPLDATDVVSFSLDNLNQLRFNIVTDNDSLIVAYTR